ncbi:hypothetical protein L6452_22938 [Arctium lappa]|uniref:Uncharacterized protein n=2 Tax=Arctium lappa TaxID=4217 RepID=A0ACB9B5I7_ARCLA|nr:hypothetical protein L6452_22937 [Arctium lappa]KAI3715946.1 hypothetical protein L6452_22938 [Arctium lappa]
MGFHWRSIFLFLVIAVAILLLSHAHNEPQDYIDAHSCLRTLVEVPPLTWDPELAKAAESWANQRKDCKMIHSGKCGESMAAGPNLNGSYAVQLWLDERMDYDYNENKCIDGCKCSHYTQAIWKNTQRIGCARVKCDPPDSPCYLVVCNYDPPGNIPGEKPY